MQRLTLMTVGAMMIGFVGFVYDSAIAQTPTSCSSREVSIYFDKDTTEFNKFSQQHVERVATEAKACGARQVVAEVKSGPDRAEAVSHAFADLGVKVILVGATHEAAAGESVADREVVVRVARQHNAVG